jgi:hypothetical protein
MTEVNELLVRILLGAWLDLAEKRIITYAEAGALFTLECRKRVLAGSLDAAQWMPNDDGALAVRTLLD